MATNARAALSTSLPFTERRRLTLSMIRLIASSRASEITSNEDATRYGTVSPTYATQVSAA
ncbi:hypothetical protein D3C83_201960 [compost metagenome]